jgi:RNA polymerase sigma-70 factor, ECF subfamily
MRLSSQARTVSGAEADPGVSLLARARTGDEDAFRLIFERYSRPVTGFLYSMVNRPDLAEELAQETFVRAYRGMHGMREESSLSTWLFGIARNVARESVRSRRRDDTRVDLDDDGVLELSDAGPAPDRQLLAKELDGKMREALGALDDDKRLVFTLKVLQQKSYEEIAEITGSSVGKLKTDLHRARAEMRKRIGPYLGGEQ